MGNYRPFLQGPLPVANYTRIIIPGRFWTRPPSTKSTRMASSAMPLHDSLIELAIPDAHAHAIKWPRLHIIRIRWASARAGTSSISAHAHMHCLPGALYDNQRGVVLKLTIDRADSTATTASMDICGFSEQVLISPQK